ncbi:MAG TPA: haloacid dehalogenase-like hydrolase [Phaeodactylibacter sp.]|nr:haloacid dehalogenase-like hydrolase [Phaeodactylibacter sp.]
MSLDNREVKKSKKKKELIVFNFNKTITRRNSMFEFIRFTHGSFSLYFYLVLFSPVFLLSKIGLVSRKKRNELLMRYLYKGESVFMLTTWGEQFCMARYNSFLRPDALDIIRQLKKKQKHIIVISESAKIWVEPFTKKLGLELIATDWEYKEGKFTGRFLTHNCCGKEKATRLKAYLNINEFQKLIVYGNSSRDKFLYKLADIHYHKYFNA